MRQGRRLAKVLVGLAVSGGLLVYLFWDVDVRAIGARLAATRWGFLAASVALNLLGLSTRARRWYYLFPPRSRPSHLFSAVMIGYMGNNLLPLRAGEVLRAYVVARRGQRLWTTVATIVVERVLDGLAVGIILAFLLLAVALPRELWWAAAMFVAADLLLLGVLAVMALAPGPCRRLLLSLARRRSALRQRLSDTLDTFNEGLRGVRTIDHVLPILAWSAANWVLWALSAWTGLRAARLELPMMAAWAVLAFVGLGVSLPSSPGFAGIVQAATVLALALFGVPRSEALSFSLLLHAAQFFPVTVWGLILGLVEHVSLAEATRAAPGPIPSSPR